MTFCVSVCSYILCVCSCAYVHVCRCIRRDDAQTHTQTDHKPCTHAFMHVRTCMHTRTHVHTHSLAHTHSAPGELKFPGSIAIGAGICPPHRLGRFFTEAFSCMYQGEQKWLWRLLCVCVCVLMFVLAFAFVRVCHVWLFACVYRPLRQQRHSRRS